MLNIKRKFWVERKVLLDELDLAIRANFERRGQLPLLDIDHPPPAALIREFYLNLSIHIYNSNTQVKCWIRGEEYTITPRVVADALGVPLVQHRVYPYSESPSLDDILSYITGSSIQWGSDPQITIAELTEIHYLFFKIACHSLWPISHLDTIPLECCVFLLLKLLSVFLICFFTLWIRLIRVLLTLMLFSIRFSFIRFCCF